MKPEKEFVSNMLGMPENTIDIMGLVSVDEDKDGFLTLNSCVNEQSFKIGKFRTMAVKEFHVHPPKKGASFNLVIGNGLETREFHKIDVGALQANPANRGATFQVASNFNCLEFVDKKGSAAQGITKYIWDYTQGPAASISAAPGTLYRNYFVEHTPEPGRTKYKGQLEAQINLLDRIPLIPVKNGYVAFETDEDWMKLKTANFDFQDFGDIKVGNQTLVQVTSGLKRNGMIEMCTDKNQVINQVFTAAMNMGGVVGIWAKDPLPEKVARFILGGAYRGTILSAIHNSRTLPDSFVGKNKCFLTMIGGGVFGNDFEWILDAIMNLYELIIDSGLEIYMVIFAPQSLDDFSLVRFRSFIDNVGAGTVTCVK